MHAIRQRLHATVVRSAAGDGQGHWWRRGMAAIAAHLRYIKERPPAHRRRPRGARRQDGLSHLPSNGVMPAH
jgi:hypothetical protein